MSFIALSPWDLVVAALLVLLLALTNTLLGVGLGRQLLIGAVRTTVQLLLIGLILKLLFAQVAWWWVLLLASVMLMVAAFEIRARQQRRLRGAWGLGLGAVAMLLSSFVVTLLALTVILQADPWYHPQYAIPLLGMLLGNTMTGIALGLDRLTSSLWQQRELVEGRLLLGMTVTEALAPLRRDSVRVGMVQIINAMAAAGVIALPGMMTGQILAGAAPLEAVKYQILIMFLIAVGTGFGTLIAVWYGARRLFDERQRLRLERLV